MGNYASKDDLNVTKANLQSEISDLRSQVYIQNQMSTNDDHNQTYITKEMLNLNNRTNNITKEIKDIRKIAAYTEAESMKFAEVTFQNFDNLNKGFEYNKKIYQPIGNYATVAQLNSTGKICDTTGKVCKNFNDIVSYQDNIAIKSSADTYLTVDGWSKNAPANVLDKQLMNFSRFPPT